MDLNHRPLHYQYTALPLSYRLYIDYIQNVMLFSWVYPAWWWAVQYLRGSATLGPKYKVFELDIFDIRPGDFVT